MNTVNKVQPAQVYSGMWIGLPYETKRYIATKFGITTSMATHVSDGVVISDGYSDKDLSALNVETLQQALSSQETDLFKLWHQYLEVVKSEMNPKKPEPVEEVKQPVEIHIKVEGDTYKVVDKPKKDVKKIVKPATTATQNEGAAN